MAAFISLCRIEKSFPGIQALQPLDIEISPGEVIGLVGENGAGKSTLIKILSGIHAPDGGEILLDGRPLRLASPREAALAGIATIHQELSCCAHLPVAEDLLLGERWPRTRWGAVAWGRLHAEARARLRAFELEIPTTRLMASLSAAEKQEVAMARALSHRSRLLVLDEPTASLSEPEVKRLLSHLRRLREANVAILYVSHRLDEILALTDRVLVLRDGALVAGYPTRECDAARLVRDMVGRPLGEAYPRTRSSEAGTVLLEVEGASCRGLFEGISLSVRAGEVVGLGGLVGAGRSELARALYGLYPLDAGRMRWKGQPWAPASPAAALAAGIVYVPEERKRQGLALEHSVGEAISIGFSDLIERCGMIPAAVERRRLRSLLETHGIRARGIQQPVGTLSGGNQQKAVLARWLSRDPELIVLDEPTRGVDVGAKAEIHGLIDRLAASGKGICMISSDLPELLAMSDRILVFHEGRIARELRGAASTQENVLLAASGLAGATA